MVLDQHDVSHVVGGVEPTHCVADHEQLDSEEFHDSYRKRALPERVALRISRVHSLLLFPASPRTRGACPAWWWRPPRPASQSRAAPGGPGRCWPGSWGWSRRAGPRCPPPAWRGCRGLTRRPGQGPAWPWPWPGCGQRWAGETPWREGLDWRLGGMLQFTWHEPPTSNTGLTWLYFEQFCHFSV